MEKREVIYAGKAKTLYHTDNSDYLIAEFRNDTSAFDGIKKAQLERKGLVNNQFNAFIMQTLEKAGVETHFVEQFSETQSVVKKLEMIPVECVIRNIAAGSLCRRLGIEQGLELNPPLFEFFLKNDELHDPFIGEQHIRAFGWATADEIEQLKNLTYQINVILQPLFAAANLLLVDFKLEFGRFEGRLVLGDEITPDGCRIWDADTRESLDKDRFRKDLGNVVEGYEEVAKRLGLQIN